MQNVQGNAIVVVVSLDVDALSRCQEASVDVGTSLHAETIKSQKLEKCSGRTLGKVKMLCAFLLGAVRPST
jgi:hypothetical protein